MEPEMSKRALTRGERETQTEAARLNEHIEEALAAVAVRSNDAADSLDSIADRIERASRDLSAALRELAEQRRITQDTSE
jgi:hypothetical protein